MVTKRMHRLDNGLLCEEAPEALDLPFVGVSREALDRLPKGPLVGTPARWVPVTGDLTPHYAPISEGVPDIPERPTVILERDCFSRGESLPSCADWLGAVKDIAAGIAFIAVATSAVAVIFWLLIGFTR